MITMMMIMILTNKESCRFIANNVVQKTLHSKLLEMYILLLKKRLPEGFGTVRHLTQ